MFQNLDYQEELEYKKEVATNILNKIGKFSFKDIPITGMEEPYYYRNKIQVPFGKDKQNRLVYGFYKFKSHDIVPITEFVIEDKVHVNILKTLKELMLSFKLEPYDEDTGYGLLRHCLIRTGKVSKETMVVLVLTNKNFKGKNNL